MIWYDMIWYDMIWYDMIWYDMIWYDMIYSLTAIGLTPGGSSTVHIYTQTIRRITKLTTTTQLTTENNKFNNLIHCSTLQHLMGAVKSRFRSICKLWPWKKRVYVFLLSRKDEAVVPTKTLSLIAASFYWITVTH